MVISHIDSEGRKEEGRKEGALNLGLALTFLGSLPLHTRITFRNRAGLCVVEYPSTSVGLLGPSTPFYFVTLFRIRTGPDV